jgi:hypothetical protein
VHGHPPRDPDADGGHLAVGATLVGPHPHTAAALDPPGRQAEAGADLDERVLEAADVRDDVHRVGQRDDRVADQLARPVPGDLAAAVHVDDRRSVEGPLVRLGALARRVDGWVLQQQHRVGAGAGDAGGVQLALAGPRLLVVDEPGPDHA